uniref:Uncharacterized protein n=1 Tax=Cucumis melo TaxID=3656 RepID=A0A9I9E605_CUCME
MSKLHSGCSKPYSVEETKNFASNILPSCFCMFHNSSRSCQHKESKLSRREQPSNPTFNFLNTHVKTRINNPTFVQPIVEFKNNFSRSMIIDKLKFTNITMLLQTRRNLMITLEDNMIMTCCFPWLFALYMLLRPSSKDQLSPSFQIKTSKDF